MYTREENPPQNVIKFDEISIGQEFKLSHTITQNDVDTFASLTGDFNPLHVDREFAQKTNFRKPVVHGMLSASFISTMIGMLIPGPGALWSSQTLEFLQPVFVGDTITVIAEVIQKSEATQSIKIKVRVANQNGHDIIIGQSLVKLLTVNEEKQVTNPSSKKTVLITGGAKGIGAAVATRLSKANYNVIIAYRSSAQEAKELVSELTSTGHSAIALKADVSVESEIVSLIQQAREKFGPITSFVHCAAPLPTPRSFENLDWETYETQFGTQVKGAYCAIKQLLPDMVEAKDGSIVFIGSIYSEGVPPTQQSPYVVAKSGLTALARTLAVEFGPRNVRVNVVSPGMTETDMIATIPEKTKMLAKMQTPLRKLANAKNVAATVAFLLSQDAEHITGENIKVCGGVSM